MGKYQVILHKKKLINLEMEQILTITLTQIADLVLDKHVLTTQHSVSFSGGSDKVRYFMNLGYMYDDKPNFMSGQDKTRYTLDTNIASDITKWFTVKGSIKYIRNVSDTEHGQPWMGTFYWFHLLWWLNSQMENGEVLPVVNRLPNLLSQAILFVL